MEDSLRGRRLDHEYCISRMDKLPRIPTLVSFRDKDDM